MVESLGSYWDAYRRKPRRRVIGRQMFYATQYVSLHEGCPILPVAEWVGPNGSRNYGYRTVHRAMEAGLIEDRGGSWSRYRLYVTDAGHALLKERTGS